MNLTYGTACSGIETASVAVAPLGWRAVWFAEIEAFPCAVLAHRYPRVPNLGDMTRVGAQVRIGDEAAPDVLIAGTPCQAFSVAGNRGGLEDVRGRLTLEFVKLIDDVDAVRNENDEPATIAVWENVPGVLSSRDNAFGCFLGALSGEDRELQPPGKRWPNAGCVYGPKRAIAWRILDAQYFGVAQRRRRLFAIASARTGFHPAQVLFEREGLRRDHPPRRGERQDVACAIARSVALRGRDGGATAELGDDLSGCLRASGGGGDKPHVLTIRSMQGSPPVSCLAPVSFAIQAGALRTNPHSGPDGAGVQAEHAYTLEARAEVQAVQTTSAVRRLTPRECERLQGLPDDYTLIPWRGKPAAECPDGLRYKAIGNSKAVPVVRWICRRIELALNTPWSNDL
ncbi:TPA: DNA cytosine methyltransferase [Pseudomonas aeruginosa]